MKNKKEITYLMLTFTVVFLAFASIVFSSISQDSSMENNGVTNESTSSYSQELTGSDAGENYLGDLSFSEVQSEILSKGQEGFNTLMNYARDIDSWQFAIKINFLAGYFSKTNIDASEMVDVLYSRGSQAKSDTDIIAVLPFMSNLGVIGAYNEATENFLIDVVSDQEFRYLVWPVLRTMKSKQLYVENAVVYVIEKGDFPGADNKISTTVQDGDRKKIYIKNAGQSWDDINQAIIDESNGTAEWREVNDREREIMLCAANALYFRGTERGLSTLRSLMVDEKEDQFFRNSISFNLQKINEYGTLEKYLEIVYARIQE